MGEMSPLVECQNNWGFTLDVKTPVRTQIDLQPRIVECIGAYDQG